MRIIVYLCSKYNAENVINVEILDDDLGELILYGVNTAMMTTMATRNKNIIPWKATCPGTILRYELEDRKISQKDFAVMIGMRESLLNELIEGKRPITKPMADKIEEVLHISAVSLINLQIQYEHDMKVIAQGGMPLLPMPSYQTKNGKTLRK